VKRRPSLGNLPFYRAQIAFLFIIELALFVLIGWILRLLAIFPKAERTHIIIAASMPTLGAVGVAIYCVWVVRWYRRTRAHTRVEAGLCLACGYDLTGNVSGTCPECGGKVG
jgi:hypothetical protein